MWHPWLAAWSRQDLLFLSLFTAFYFFLGKKKLLCVPIDWGPVYMLKRLSCFMPLWTHIPDNEYGLLTFLCAKLRECCDFEIWCLITPWSTIVYRSRVRYVLKLAWLGIQACLACTCFYSSVSINTLPSCFHTALQHHKTISKPFQNLWFTSIRTCTACAVCMLCH